MGDSNLKTWKSTKSNHSGLPKPECRVLTADEAAQYLGYARANAAFYAFLASCSVKPLADRKGAYDRLALDRALDTASGFASNDEWGQINYGQSGL